MSDGKRDGMGWEKGAAMDHYKQATPPDERARKAAEAIIDILNKDGVIWPLRSRYAERFAAIIAQHQATEKAELTEEGRALVEVGEVLANPIIEYCTRYYRDRRPS